LTTLSNPKHLVQRIIGLWRFAPCFHQPTVFPASLGGLRLPRSRAFAHPTGQSQFFFVLKINDIIVANENFSKVFPLRYFPVYPWIWQHPRPKSHGK
jgi:hypothetical protein